jgi:hypothetical protein
MIGLGNVDNTSDTSKPISTATQTALNLKAYWDYELEKQEVIEELTTHSFSITQSLQGGIRGPNSDPKYDNKSESRSRSHSSKRSTQSGY